MINAAILNGTTVVNIIVLNDLSEYFGAVECPEWVCIGDDINKLKPDDASKNLILEQPVSTGAQTL